MGDLLFAFSKNDTGVTKTFLKDPFGYSSYSNL